MTSKTKNNLIFIWMVAALLTVGFLLGITYEHARIQTQTMSYPSSQTTVTLRVPAMNPQLKALREQFMNAVQYYDTAANKYRTREITIQVFRIRGQHAVDQMALVEAKSQILQEQTNDQDTIRQYEYFEQNVNQWEEFCYNYMQHPDKLS